MCTVFSFEGYLVHVLVCLACKKVALSARFAAMVTSDEPKSRGTAFVLKLKWSTTSRQAGRQQVSDHRQCGQSLSRNSGGESGHGFYGPAVQGPRVEHGVLPNPNLIAGGSQYHAGGQCGTTGVSNNCTGYSNTGPSLMAGNEWSPDQG